MMKNYLVFFLLFCVSVAVSAQNSGAVSARNNVFCENKLTTAEECLAVSRKMYQDRVSFLARRYAKTTKAKEGKDVDRKVAFTEARRMMPMDKFNEAFKMCGETSEDQDKARLCLEQKLRADSRGRPRPKRPQK